MAKRILIHSIIASFLLTAIGCEPSGPPQIIGRVKRHSFTPSVPAVSPVKPSSIRPAADPSAPAGWIPPRRYEKKWKAIVVHHSYTKKGNVKLFDNYHKNGHKWKGIGYDFVIGNGNGSGDGKVEKTFRWDKQIAGAHCGGTPNNWANEDGIGICLVGDFTRYRPTERQMASLVKLTRFLQKRYNIPKSRVYGHRTTPGYKNGTECPGKYFPMTKFKAML